MGTITCTIRQWNAIARFLSAKELYPCPHLRDHALAAKIRQATSAAPFAHPDSLLALVVTPEERATLERATPMTAWWMPPTPGEVVLKREASAAVLAAEAIIQEHQRRPNT